MDRECNGFHQVARSKRVQIRWQLLERFCWDARWNFESVSFAQARPSSGIPSNRIPKCNWNIFVGDGRPGIRRLGSVRSVNLQSNWTWNWSLFVIAVGKCNWPHLNKIRTMWLSLLLFAFLHFTQLDSLMLCSLKTIGFCCLSFSSWFKQILPINLWLIAFHKYKISWESEKAASLPLPDHCQFVMPKEMRELKGSEKISGVTWHFKLPSPSKTRNWNYKISSKNCYQTNLLLLKLIPMRIVGEFDQIVIGLSHVRN